MTDKQFYKLLAWIVGAYVALIILMVATCKADDGLETIFSSEYIIATIPETRWVLITEERAWNTICLFHFPNKNPSYIAGIALKDRDARGNWRYTVFMPLYQSAYNGSFMMMELVAGHEFMHIADYYMGGNGFDPDRRERAELNGLNGEKRKRIH